MDSIIQALFSYGTILSPSDLGVAELSIHRFPRLLPARRFPTTFFIAGWYPFVISLETYFSNPNKNMMLMSSLNFESNYEHKAAQFRNKAAS